MLAISSVPGFRSQYFVVMLWIAWLTLLWAGFSRYMFQHPSLPSPYVIQLLTVLSGAISFVGGCIGALYVILAARTWPLLLLGVCASLANFGYFSWYLNALMHQ